MTPRRSWLLLPLLCLAATHTPAHAQSTKCPPDSVRSGSICIDTFESSLWSVPATERSLIKKIEKGKVTADDLANAGGTQLGVTSDDYGAACLDSGAGCTHVYAVSLSGVLPSRYLTWLQAAAACRNSGKRMPTNAEWQAAALGTQDPGFGDGITGCKTNDGSSPPGGTPVPTGSASNCVSDIGAHDMVGNIWEWVQDWNLANGGQEASTVVARGGSFHDGAIAAYAVSTISTPSSPPYGAYDAGVRCVR